MSFRDAGWDERYKTLGDIAEQRFETYCRDKLKVNCQRFGLNRPNIRLANVPARLRYTPDFVLHDTLVEVQGLGKDGKLKLKIDKWGALHHWNDMRTEKFHGVQLYVWDSYKERECMFPLGLLDELLNERRVELASFVENKAYFAYNADEVFARAGA